MPARPSHRRASVALTLVLLLLAPAQPAGAYSVLSHEQVVDLAWKTHIIPLLQARYPGLTTDQLKDAHAYAYGGAIIQDIGYYPFGSKLLSDMLHYVRSGDFVANLIRESSTPEEYAFALGALAHYTSDTYGHPAVNVATGKEYPKLRQRYGPVVTYHDSPRSHLQTEYGFDVLEVVQQRYAPEGYHDFIGFQVAKPVFERAFQDTYGLPLDQVLTNEDLAIGTYRKTVSGLLPKMTQVAVADYGKKLQQAEPTFVPKHLLYRLDKADYQKQWGRSYQKPGFGARTLALFLRLLPKIGPLKDLSLRVPDADTQKQFLAGMNTVVDRYHDSLDILRAQPPDQPSLKLASVDLDTGKPTAPGEYPLADQTYARYLAVLVRPRLYEAPATSPPPPPNVVSAPVQTAIPTGMPTAVPIPAAAAQPVVNADIARPPAKLQPVAAERGQTAQPAPQPSPQPVDPAIRADIEHYFAQATPGTLQLKKNQWKALPNDLEKLKQLPVATPIAASEMVKQRIGMSE